METELQSNKQHIQQLLQQLNAITSKQASTPQADHHPCTGATHPQHHSPALVMRSRLAASALGYSTSSSASHNSMGMQADTSSRDDQDEVTSGVMQHASEPCPLGDATNRFSSSSNRWQQHSSPALHPCGPGGGLKSPFPSRSPAAGAENSPPRPDHQNYEQATRTAAAAATTVTAAAAHQADEQDPRQQVLQQQDSRQLLDVQRQMEELQQRAMQLEAENAELKSAQAVATAEIDSLKLLQQAEQLKQVWLQTMLSMLVSRCNTGLCNILSLPVCSERTSIVERQLTYEVLDSFHFSTLERIADHLTGHVLQLPACIAAR